MRRRAHRGRPNDDQKVLPGTLDSGYDAAHSFASLWKFHIVNEVWGGERSGSFRRYTFCPSAWRVAVRHQGFSAIRQARSFHPQGMPARGSSRPATLQGLSGGLDFPGRGWIASPSLSFSNVPLASIPCHRIGTEHGTHLKVCVPCVPLESPCDRNNVPALFRPVPCSAQKSSASLFCFSEVASKRAAPKAGSSARQE